MKGPVFIGGQERCGTSLVRAVLGSHPDLAIYEWDLPVWREIFPAGRRFWQRLGNEALAQFLLRELLLDPKAKDSSVEWDAEDLLRQLESLDLTRVGTYPALAARVFSLFFEEYASLRGRSRWGLKTPENEYFAADIMAAHPDATFVHVWRDPYPAIASAKAAGWTREGQGQVASRALRWCRSIEALIENQESYGPRYLGVCYDRFVETPEISVRLLCAALDLDFAPAMLDMEGHPGWSGSNSSFGVESNSISTSLSKKAVTNLNEGDRRQIAAILEAYQPLLERRYPGFDLARFEAEALCKLGESLFVQGKVESAQQAFEMATELGPELDTAYNGLAVTSWRQGEQARALKCALRAIEITPLYRQALLNCASMLCAMGRSREAHELCSAYLEQVPADRTVSIAAMELDRSQLAALKSCGPGFDQWRG